MLLFENCKIGDKVYTKDGDFFGYICLVADLSISVVIKYRKQLHGWPLSFITYNRIDGSLAGIPVSLENMKEVHYVVPEHLIRKQEEEVIELYLDDEDEYNE